jgi:hypothetical protein
MIGKAEPFRLCLFSGGCEYQLNDEICRKSSDLHIGTTRPSRSYSKGSPNE